MSITFAVLTYVNFNLLVLVSNIEWLVIQDELRQKKEEELDDYASQVYIWFERAYHHMRLYEYIKIYCFKKFVLDS